MYYVLLCSLSLSIGMHISGFPVSCMLIGYLYINISIILLGYILVLVLVLVLVLLSIILISLANTAITSYINVAQTSTLIY